MEITSETLLNMTDNKFSNLVTDALYDGDSGTIHSLFFTMIKKFPDTLWLLECFSFAIDDAIHEGKTTKEQFEEYETRAFHLYNNILRQGKILSRNE